MLVHMRLHIFERHCISLFKYNTVSDLAPRSDVCSGNVIKGWDITDSIKYNNEKSGHILLDIDTVKTYD